MLYAIVSSAWRPDSFCSMLVREANLDFARTMLGCSAWAKTESRPPGLNLWWPVNKFVVEMFTWSFMSDPFTLDLILWCSQPWVFTNQTIGFYKLDPLDLRTSATMNLYIEVVEPHLGLQVINSFRMNWNHEPWSPWYSLKKKSLRKHRGVHWSQLEARRMAWKQGGTPIRWRSHLRLLEVCWYRKTVNRREKR